MANTKANQSHCMDNGVSYKIGERWSDHGVCNLKICEPGGNITIKLCPTGMSTRCSRPEGDLNQDFPLCCPTLDSDDDESSSSSSSSSSSEEDEDDLFDDDDGNMDGFMIGESTHQNVRNSEDPDDSSNVSTNTNAPKTLEQDIGQVKIIEDVNGTSHKLKNTSELNKVTETVVSNANTDRDVPDREGFPDGKSTVLQDITNTEILKTNETPINYDSCGDSVPESQESRNSEQQNNDHVTKDGSESSVVEKQNENENTSNIKKVDANSMDKSTELSNEYETVENLRSMREYVTRDIKDVETIYSRQVTRNNSQESMDSVNYSALGQNVKEEKDVPILQVMDEIQETNQHHDYMEQIDHDSKTKVLTEFQTSVEQNNAHCCNNSSVLKDVNDTNSELLKSEQELVLQDDRKYTESIDNIEPNMLNEKHVENTEPEEQNLEGSIITRELYNMDIKDGVIFNPEDSEGFLKRPEDDIMESTLNETKVERDISNKEDISNIFSINSQQEILEHLNHNNTENQLTEELNSIKVEDLHEAGEIEMIQNIENSERNIQAYSNSYDTSEIGTKVHDHDEGPCDINPSVSIDNTDFSEQMTENIVPTANVDNLAAFNIANTADLNEEISVLSRNVNAITEDTAELNSLDINNFENHAQLDIEGIDDVRPEAVDVFKNEEEESANILQDIGDSEGTIQAPEESNISLHEMHGVTDDQSHSTENSSTMEETTESTSTIGVAEGFDNSTDNTDDIQ